MTIFLKIAKKTLLWPNCPFISLQNNAKYAAIVKIGNDF
jgi:hypothetical protein